MSEDNKEFFELLKTVIAAQTLPIKFTNKQVYNFKPLTTAQLTRVIKTVVDQTPTKTSFNSAITKLMIETKPENLTETDVKNFNIIDKLLYILDNRIQLISNNVRVRSEDNQESLINLEQLKQQIHQETEKENNAFEFSVLHTDDIEITLGMPSIQIEDEANEEIYSKINLNPENPEELEAALGEAFVSELAKYIKEIKIKDTVFNLNDKNIKNRIEIVESLPASLIQKVIEKVEKIKKTVETAISVNGIILSIDGTLFSVH